MSAFGHPGSYIPYCPYPGHGRTFIGGGGAEALGTQAANFVLTADQSHRGFISAVNSGATHTMTFPTGALAAAGLPIGTRWTQVFMHLAGANSVTATQAGTGHTLKILNGSSASVAANRGMLLDHTVTAADTYVTIATLVQ